LIFFCALPLRVGAQGTGTNPPIGTMSYLDNGQIRIGVDLGLGGAITYLSKSGSDENVINSADKGREVQMSFYSGPVPFTPHGKQPVGYWAALGWNPIQCGDAFGHTSRIIENHNDGQEIYVKCVPLQWPLDSEPGECTFETWIRLEGRSAHVASRIVNHRSDHTQYPAYRQELPAVYTNGPWYRVMTYQGNKPYTGDTLTQVPQGPGLKFPAEYQATENWTALVNDAGWGIGVWEPGVYYFKGGFSGPPGSGGPHDAPTGYISPTYKEILDADITYGYHYVLILDTMDGIRHYVYQHATAPTPPDYRFSTDRQHWSYANASDAGWPIHDELKVTLDQNDPQMLGPDGLWPASQAPKLYIQAAFHTPPGIGQIFWKRADAPEFSASRCLSFPLIPDDKYHTYVIDLSASPEYTGTITGLRFDPEPVGRPGDYVRVRSISFRKPD
jgi:hypothetical protein